MNEKRIFTIATATKSQAEEICSLLHCSITQLCVKDHNQIEARLTKWLVNKTPQSIIQWIENDANYIIVSLDTDKKIVGVSMLSQDGKILLHYVMPDYIGLGIGTLMLRVIEQFAREKKIERIFTCSTKTAIDFYIKNGYKLNPNEQSLCSEGIAICKVLSTNHRV